MMRALAIAVAASTALFLPDAAFAQSTRTRAIQGVDVTKLANGILALMSYTVVPDVTTSSLSLSNSQTANPSLFMTQLGGGFTWSKETPLYLEGNAAYARYDPVFLASDGDEQRRVPVRWNSVSVTAGIGWDFQIAEHWVARPMLNLTWGYVASDLQIGKWWVENNTDLDLSFMDGGKLKAYGVGGTMMFDFEDYKPEREIDFEGRYTYMPLQSYDSHLAVEGTAVTETMSLWARWRAPTGWHAMDRPVRYVLEAAHTEFFGEQRELGIERLNSVGVGLELDSSAHDIWVTRWRAVVRHKFGPGVSGWSLGLAVSF